MSKIPVALFGASLAPLLPTPSILGAEASTAGVPFVNRNHHRPGEQCRHGIVPGRRGGRIAGTKHTTIADREGRYQFGGVEAGR